MQPKDVRNYCRKRYYVMTLCFLGNCILFILQVNLSICLVEMTSKKTIIRDNITYIQPAEYEWTPSERGMVLGSVSWGMMTSPLTVIFVKKLGVAAAYSLAMFLIGLQTILSPIFIQSGWHVFIAGRFMTGVSQGLAVSAVCGVCANWIPPNEKSRLVNFQSVGVSVGIIIGYPLSGYLTHFMNWRNAFYIIVDFQDQSPLYLSIVWISTVSSSPSTDIFIAKDEKLYLQAVVQPSSQKTELYLWKKMLKSKPVLAFLNETFVQAWSFSFLAIEIPIFIKGAVTLILLVAGIWRNFYGCIILLCLIRICYAAAESAYSILPLDLAAGHAANIQSLKSTVVSTGNFLNAVIMSYMVANHTYSEWSHYFWFLSVFNLWGLLIYSRYGSGELQSWAAPNESI